MSESTIKNAFIKFKRESPDIELLISIDSILENYLATDPTTSYALDLASDELILPRDEIKEELIVLLKKIAGYLEWDKPTADLRGEYEQVLVEETERVLAKLEGGAK